MRLNEFDDTIQDIRAPNTEREKIIKHFVSWVAKRIKVDIDKINNIEFSYDKEDAQKQHRTGSYDWHNQEMLVYVGNRNLVDILRTIAHELQHVKQDQENRIRVHSPPGSKLEVEADAVAGYLMKLYGKLHPEIFE